MAKASSKGKKKLSFEDSLKRLEEIVERLEDDDLGLEESLELFEEGMELARVCGRRLDEAEKRVTLLVKDRQGVLEQEPFEQDLEE